MPPIEQSPTPYAAVNGVLGAILAGAHSILGERLLAMYVDGSLALGDFEHDSSDIDFVIVTDGEIAAGTLAELQAMHARIATRDSRWATEVEGSYISRHALRRFDPTHTCFPRIQRNPGAQLRMEEHASDWVVHRYVLREYGKTLVGPRPAALIDPVDPDELRRAMIDYMRHAWWVSLQANAGDLRHSGYHQYVVLTICRVLYTLEHGAVVSKPSAARWSASGPAARWKGVIERAQALPSELKDRDVSETLALIRFAIERARET